MKLLCMVIGFVILVALISGLIILAGYGIAGLANEVNIHVPMCVRSYAAIGLSAILVGEACFIVLGMRSDIKYYKNLKSKERTYRLSAMEGCYGRYCQNNKAQDERNKSQEDKNSEGQAEEQEGQPKVNCR